MRYFVFIWCYMICAGILLPLIWQRNNDTIQNTITITNNKGVPLSISNKPTKKQHILKEISIIMGGDTLLHKAVYMDGEKEFKENPSIDKSSKIKQNKSMYDFTNMLKLITPIIQKHDLAFYNQESMLGGTKLGLSSYPTFNSPQEFGDSMLEAGFNLISIANNHTLDKGEKGVLSSLEYWKRQSNKRDIIVAGSYESTKDRNTPRILKKNDITYTLLAYTYGTNGIPIPKGKEYLVNVYTKEMLKNDIAAIRDKVDLLIVSIHWGVEYTFKPTKEQREIAKLLAELGVDIVIGNHPHFIQPIEMIKDCLIIYSLGNMLSAQKGLERKIGMLVSLNVMKNEVNLNAKPSTNPNISDSISMESDMKTIAKSSAKKVILRDIKAELIYTYHDDKNRNFKIIPFSKLNNSILPRANEIKKEYIKKIKLDKQDNISIN